MMPLDFVKIPYTGWIETETSSKGNASCISLSFNLCLEKCNHLDS